MMMGEFLNKVTITGIDDSVDVDDLIKLSEEFPFVEWGVLFSKNLGSPRYPSFQWLETLVHKCGDIFNRQNKTSFAAHLCGDYARDLVYKSEFSFDSFFDNFFDRYQINYHDSYWNEKYIYNILNFISSPILPVKDFELSSLKEDLYLLYDVSWGQGKISKDWPKQVNSMCGYAGGINPDNISDVIFNLQKVCDYPTWIDMETGVRTESKFDLEKVRFILEKCKPFVLEESFIYEQQ